MNLNNDDFYKTLKERLEQLPEPKPTQEDWESFTAFSQQNKNKSIFWYIIPVSLLISLTLMSYFFLVQTAIKTNNIAEASTVARKGSIARTYSPATKIKSKTNQFNANKKLKESSKSPEIIDEKTNSTTNNTKPTNTASNKALSENTITKIILSPSTILTEPNLAITTSPEIENVWLVSKEVKALPSNLFYAVPKPLTFGSSQKIKRPLQADWISAWAIPILTNNNNKSLMYGAGFQIGKDVGNGWSFAAGLEYAQANSQQSQNWKHAFESHDLIRIDTNLRMDASLNRIIMVMDSVYDYRIHEENVTSQTLTNSRNIDIPIEVGYGIGLGKLLIGSTIGIYNRIKHTQTNQLENYPLSNYEKSAYSEKYSYQLLSSLGLSAAYPINKRFWVQASPTLLLNPFEGKTTYTETRFRIGIKYYLY